MNWLGHWIAASCVAASIGGCECDCAGARLEVVDAQTGEVVEGARIAFAESIYSPRIRAEGWLPSGEFHVWVRAAGYRNWHSTIDVPLQCLDEGEKCVRPVETIEVERR